jgi:hypothetical protein
MRSLRVSGSTLADRLPSGVSMRIGPRLLFVGASPRAGDASAVRLRPLSKAYPFCASATITALPAQLAYGEA